MKILDGIDGITVQMLTHKDVVRHRLVQQIIKAYEKADAETEKKQCLDLCAVEEFVNEKTRR